MEQREQLAWTLFGLALLSAAIFAWQWHGAKVKPPVVIEKRIEVEVPKEVIKEVPKEVLREVIKEVPKEVIRVVDRPVEKIWTPREAAEFLNQKAAFINERQSLGGFREISVKVIVSGPLREKLDVENMQTKAELALRKNRIPVSTEKGFGCLVISVDSMWVSEPNNARPVLMVFSSSAQFETDGLRVQNEAPVIGTAVWWRKGHFGYAGADRLKEQALNLIDAAVEHFSNDFLAANPGR